MSAQDRENDHLMSSRSSFLSVSLTHLHISEAIEHSCDNGATLTFSKLNLSHIGTTAAEELAAIGRDVQDSQSPLKRYIGFCAVFTNYSTLTYVVRIALGNNHLTTLPTEFALLSRLRYLNLKHNNFSTFPDVVGVLFYNFGPTVLMVAS